MDIILVHGAWHNEHCWEEFTPTVRAEGLVPHVLTLPGHVAVKGKKPAPSTSITMARYADAVISMAESLAGPAIVMGHSMGGYVISSALERRPDLFSKAIYLTALVPEKRGVSLMFSHFGEMAADLLSWNVLNPLAAKLHFKPAKAANVLYNRCSERQQNAAIAHLCPQPLRPLFSPVPWTEERMGSVPKYYIECADDNTLPLDFQRRWQERAGFEDVITLDADHSPFLSAKSDLVSAVYGIADR